MDEWHEPYFRFETVLLCRGIKHIDIASLLGISILSLLLKIYGVRDFTYSEAKKLYQNYGIGIKHYS